MPKNIHFNPRIKTVTNFKDLVETPLQGSTNAVGWLRNLNGNFEEIVAKLQLKDHVSEISMNELLNLKLSEQGSLARDVILNDFKLLSDFGALPSLNLIKNYEQDTELDFISTDVYSFHVDRSPLATDTFLCTYHGATSDILLNEDAEQKILIPEIRQQLKNIHQGSDSEFEDFLQEYYFDLHYQPMPHAQPMSLGQGHVWRLAVQHPDQQVEPCIHRAPKELDGEFRLLLIC